jgi:hypothetical protein
MTLQAGHSREIKPRSLLDREEFHGTEGQRCISQLQDFCWYNDFHQMVGVSYGIERYTKRWLNANCGPETC